MLGVEGVGAEGAQSLVVQHCAKLLLIGEAYFAYLVAGAEAVEEMHKGDTALDGAEMGNTRHIRRLLNRSGGKLGKARLAAGHNVAVVAENTHCVSAHGAGGNVEHNGELFARYAVENGDHQHKTLT